MIIVKTPHDELAKFTVTRVVIRKLSLRRFLSADSDGFSVQRSSGGNFM